MKLILRPVDTFTFRDHRDFNAGENTAGFSFPFPTPSTLYGALRSAYIYYHSDFDTFARGADKGVKEWMGTPSSYGRFQVLGTFIEHRGEVYLPVPMDMQIISNENKDTGEVNEYAVPLSLIKEKPKSSDEKSYRLIAKHDGKSSSAKGAYISLTNYKKLNFGEVEQAPVYRLNTWIVAEEKTGIFRDNFTRRTKESMFYQLLIYRFKNEKETTFTTYLSDAPSFEKVRFARVGRKGRPWIIETKDDNLSILTERYREKIEKEIRQSGIAKLMFLTPTFFENGTYPLIEGEQKLSISRDLELEVITIATDRPEVIGGFDIVKKRPKPRKNVISEGTVIYVKVPEDKVSLLIETAQLHILTDDRNREGYGLCTLTSGKINYEGVL
ncbi:type III-B CRISPR module-associated protein Cmr3 [Pueribacillus theae]|uniref:Type III-B CRISPR module-associated protein Cmr3 n=1 Tax=Pueribacillus theae TaxID=2171751 RepID=A0A2U1K6D7_9BACI|nr:type III-B CRISPR module-associated protein Cmr3 [Pueribacillus theae]PWA13087.1 type III-B CRISPR module-associated protein Cmr3 [Pueribacillus theae]